MKGGALLPIIVVGLTPTLVLALILIGLSLGPVAWKPSVIWTDTFGGPTPYNHATAIASDSRNLYVAGYFSHQLSNESETLFLKRYEPSSGNSIWTRAIGSTRSFSIRGATLGSGGVYLTGSINESAAVVKYGADGSPEWTSKFGGQSSFGMAISSIGTMEFVAGITSGPITSQLFTGNVLFVRGYDPNGNILWTSEFSNSSDFVQGIHADPSGVYILTYHTFLKYDSNGNKLWNNSRGGEGLSGDGTGEYVSYNAFLNKYDSDGNKMWNVRSDSPDGSGVFDSLVTADASGVYLSMDSYNGNGFVARFDSNGNPVWSFQTQTRPLLSLAFENGAPPAYLIATGSGQIYIAGESESPGAPVFVQALSQSSSLIFFGLNPPLSFIASGILAGIAVISLWLFRRRYNRRAKRPQSAIVKPTFQDTIVPRVAPTRWAFVS